MSGTKTVRPRVLIVMGVSGSGKTSVAVGLQERLGWPYQEGDELHPKENVAKMRAGIPLDDEDRKPWLATCARWIRERHEAGTGGILTCSALKRRYRDALQQGLDDVVFVYLRVPEDLLRQRLEKRTGHYMPSSLLPTQLRDFEVPQLDERVITVTSHEGVVETVDAVMECL